MNPLFERFDDLKHWERPRNFDWQTESRLFDAFVADLEARLSGKFDAETGGSIQDASFHSQIALPGGTLRFSNFGRMIAFVPDADVSDDVMAAVRELANFYGYTLIPTPDLERSYPHSEAMPGVATWWIRFFDYL